MSTSNRWLPAGSLCLLIAALFCAGASRASADQSIAVLVNDEPITTYDVAQRQKFLGLTGSSVAMRAKLANKAALNKQFRDFAMSRNPTSQQEVVALQKEFIQRLQRQAIAETSGKMKKEAIDELINERLQIQAAKKLSIVISDAEVDKMLSQMAGSGQKKLSLSAFLKQFSSQGVNPSTLRERIRAQLAWRDVIRRVYGARVASAAPMDVGASTVSSVENTVLDLRILHLSLPHSADQKAIARRVREAESVRQRFSSCAGLSKLVKPLADATIKTASKTKISAYPASARAMLIKASAGQMTPPVVNKNGVEAYAVCSKRVVAAASPNKHKTDKRQEDFQIYARRHLKDIKQNARIEYPKGG
jgi:peptidyl-prolyl cis-trans isomerase SurA